MTDDRLKTESAGRPWLKQGGSREVARRAGVDCRERSTPAGEASLNPVPHASRGLLPLVHYCPKAGFGTYLEAGAAVSVLVPSPAKLPLSRRFGSGVSLYYYRAWGRP